MGDGCSVWFYSEVFFRQNKNNYDLKTELHSLESSIET